MHRPNDMKSVVYISSAVNFMAEDDLSQILKISRVNNTQQNLTGLLLFSEGTFMQFLEGEDDNVDQTFEKIERDPRHRDLFKIMDGPIAQRNFTEWSMAFTTLNAQEMEHVKGFINSTDAITSLTDNHKNITLIKAFLKTNNLILSI